MDRAGVVVSFPGFRMEDDLLWPDNDQECASVIVGQSRSIGRVVNYCKRRRTVIQAGGNCGLWPRILSPMFDAVYTFEPDAKNFGALAVNTIGAENIFAARAILGEKAETVDLFREEINCGAYNVSGSGQIPTIRIDDLAFPDVDLIYLDVEGYELRALRGGEETLKKCHPVVCVEEKHLGNRFFDEPKGAVTAYLTGLGYRLQEKVHNDLVFTA